MNASRTIGVAGAGNIGGMLVAGGRRIALLARPRVIAEIEASGLRPTSFEGFDRTIDANAFTLSDNPSVFADAGVVLVTVKSADTAVAQDRGTDPGSRRRRQRLARPIAGTDPWLTTISLALKWQ